MESLQTDIRTFSKLKDKVVIMGAFHAQPGKLTDNFSFEGHDDPLSPRRNEDIIVKNNARLLVDTCRISNGNRTKI